jgi:glycerol-3-phosphate acyltransferase PlsX
LGVKGVCIIGHGSSNAPAVQAALRVAADTVQAGLVDEVVKRLGAGGRSKGEA